MSKFNKILGITNLILWTGLLLSVVFLNINASSLKDIAIGAVLIVIIDIGFDLLGDRKERIKKEVLVKRMQEFIKEEKQGDK